MLLTLLSHVLIPTVNFRLNMSLQIFSLLVGDGRTRASKFQYPTSVVPKVRDLTQTYIYDFFLSTQKLMTRLGNGPELMGTHPNPFQL